MGRPARLAALLLTVLALATMPGPRGEGRAQSPPAPEAPAEDTAGAADAFAAGLAAFRAGDHAAARDLLAPLAEAGEARAAFLMGQMHAEGLGGPADPAQAIVYWQRAADGPAPDRYALYSLGVAYERGEGVEADAAAAAGYYRRAAERGLPAAALNLAVLHLDGRGVPADPDRAFALALDAMLGGLDPAGDLVQRLSGRIATRPPLAGTWQVADHLSPPDRMAGERHAAALAAAIGGRLRLGPGRFALDGLGCGAPSFTAATQDLNALLLTTTGATDALTPAWPGPLPARGETAPVVTVVCGTAVPATAMPMDAESLLVGFADGYLVGLPVPAGAIERLQARLARAGHDPGPVDGLLGPLTLSALDAFRRAQGAERAGILSAALDGALSAAIARREAGDAQPDAVPDAVPGAGADTNGDTGADTGEP